MAPPKKSYKGDDKIDTGSYKKEYKSGDEIHLPNTYKAGDEIDAGIEEPEVDSLFATPKDRSDWDKKLNKFKPIELDPRQQEIDNLLKSYESAKEKERTARIGTGIAARTMAISNPNAAKAILDTRTPLDTMESDKIGEKLGLESKRLSNDSSMQKVTYEDQLQDKNSNASNLFRSQLRAAGIEVSDEATAKDMQTVFPWLKTETQAETSRRGQDIVAETKDEDRASREDVAGKNRTAAQTRTETMAKAGIGRTIISGAMSQEQAQSKGTSDAAQRAANDATIPDSFNGTGFLVLKPGMPPRADRVLEVDKLGFEASRYAKSLSGLLNLVKQANGRPNIFDSNWPTIKAKYTEAVQRNIKFAGNGVANGPDIDVAVNQIGSYDDFINWLRGGAVQQLENQINVAKEQFYAGADAAGYMPSEKPSETTQQMGTGGSQSGRRPMNPATVQGANQAAGAFGFGPVVGQGQAPIQPQGTPVTVTLKDGTTVKAIKTPDGRYVRQ